MWTRRRHRRLDRQHARRRREAPQRGDGEDGADQQCLEPDRTHQCHCRRRVPARSPARSAASGCAWRARTTMATIAELRDEDPAIAGRYKRLQRLHLDHGKDDAGHHHRRDRIRDQPRKPPERHRGVGSTDTEQERERHERAGPAGDADSVQEDGRPRQPVRGRRRRRDRSPQARSRRREAPAGQAAGAPPSRAG